MLSLLAVSGLKYQKAHIVKVEVDEISTMV